MGSCLSVIEDLPRPPSPPRLHASELVAAHAAERQQLRDAGGAGATATAAANGDAAIKRISAGSLERQAGASPAACAVPGTAGVDGAGSGGADARRSSAAAQPHLKHHHQQQQQSAAAVAAAEDGAAAPLGSGDVDAGPPFSWTKGELIGNGAFGCVFAGLNNETGELIAVKQVSLPRDDALRPRVSETLRALEAEVAVLRTLRHDNIVRYLGTHRTGDAVCILLEYVHGGSIAGLLSRFGPLQEAVVRVYTRQILRGLEYLHARGIVHRDIKGANILVDKGSTVKLADFGASKVIESLATVGAGCNSIRGTPYWMAPEVIKQTGHGRPADIWSVGCTVIEMATGKPPWSQYATPVAAMFQIASSKRPPAIPDHLSPQAKDFLLACFSRVPGERPSAAALLRHPFVAEATGGAGSAAAVAQVVSSSPEPQQQPPEQQPEQQEPLPPPPQQQQQQMVEQPRRSSPPPKPAAGSPQTGERITAGVAAAMAPGVLTAAKPPSPLRSVQLQSSPTAGERMQQGGAAANGILRHPLVPRPLYSPLSSSRVGLPSVAAGQQGAVPQQLSPLSQQPGLSKQGKPLPQQAQGSPLQPQAQQQQQQQPSPLSPSSQQPQPQERPAPPPPAAAAAAAAAAAGPMAGFNPIQEPSWMAPEYAAAAATSDADADAPLLPPRRRSVYDDSGDAPLAAAAALAAAQRRPARRLTEAGNGVAALGSVAAAAAAAAAAEAAAAQIAADVPVEASVPAGNDDGALPPSAGATQMRPLHRLTEAGCGVAAPERAAPAALLCGPAAAAPQFQHLHLRLPGGVTSNGGCCGDDSPDPLASLQESMEWLAFEQDTAPQRGADSPRAGSPARVCSSPKQLPRAAAAAGARGPLGRGLVAAVRSRGSPHDSLASSAGDASPAATRKSLAALRQSGGGFAGGFAGGAFGGSGHSSGDALSEAAAGAVRSSGSGGNRSSGGAGLAAAAPRWDDDTGRAGEGTEAAFGGDDAPRQPERTPLVL